MKRGGDFEAPLSMEKSEDILVRLARTSASKCRQECRRSEKSEQRTVEALPIISACHFDQNVQHSARNTWDSLFRVSSNNRTKKKLL